MGYFDELETSVDDIPVGFDLPNGEHEVIVSEVTEVDKKDGGKAVVIKYVVQGGPLAGRNQQQWLTVPNRSMDAKKQMTFASFLKQGLMNIGVPEGMVGDFNAKDPDHLDLVIGNFGILKIQPQKSNPEYKNITFFLEEDHKAPEPSGVSDVNVPSTSSASPSAEADSGFDLSKFGV